MLTPEQQILLDGSSTLDFFAQSAAVRGGAHLWPNGVVPYTLHRSLSSKFASLHVLDPIPLALSTSKYTASI